MLALQYIRRDMCIVALPILTVEEERPRVLHLTKERDALNDYNKEVTYCSRATFLGLQHLSFNFTNTCDIYTDTPIAVWKEKTAHNA